MLIAITFIDIDHFIIPNEFIIFGLIVSFFAHAFNFLPISILQGFYGIIAFGGTLFVMGALGRGHLKRGSRLWDVKLGLVLGSFLGVNSHYYHYS